MKKLFSALACLLCAAMLTATGFAASSDAYSIYKKAVLGLNGAKSLEMSGTSKITMEMDGAEISSTTQKSTAKMLFSDGDKMQMEMHVKDAELGLTIDQYYKDGYMYQNTDGEKTKYKLDIENAVSSAGAPDTDFGEDVFKDATVEQTADGTRIKFKVKMDDLKNSDDSSMVDEIAKSMPGSKIRIGNISYSMLIGPDNQLKTYAFAFNMTIDYEGMTIKAKYNASYKVVSINKVSKIDFPADLSSYKKV